MISKGTDLHLRPYPKRGLTLSGERVKPMDDSPPKGQTPFRIGSRSGATCGEDSKSAGRMVYRRDARCRFAAVAGGGLPLRGGCGWRVAGSRKRVAEDFA